jgi:hypothetical protein
MFDEGSFDEQIETVNGAMRAYDGTFYELPERRIHGPRPDHRQRLLIENIRYLAKRAGNAQPERALAAIHALKKSVSELERETVLIFHSHGVSWRTIAHHMGSTAATVHRRFAR